MVFNTGAALLDAVVWRCSKEKKGLTGIRSRRMCVEFWMFRVYFVSGAQEAAEG